jgi:hypothetical protein
VDLASVSRPFVRSIDGHPRPTAIPETSPSHGSTLGMGQVDIDITK